MIIFFLLCWDKIVVLIKQELYLWHATHAMVDRHRWFQKRPKFNSHFCEQMNYSMNREFLQKAYLRKQSKHACTCTYIYIKSIVDFQQYIYKSHFLIYSRQDSLLFCFSLGKKYQVFGKWSLNQKRNKIAVLKNTYDDILWKEFSSLYMYK